MARRMEVVGGIAAQVVGYDDNGYPIVVTGDVMGEDDGEEVGRARGKRGRHLVSVQKPAWRQPVLAPGVNAPDEGMETLPMGEFTYTLANQTNTFSGQVQVPFRGERWLISVVRTGASATGRIMGQIFMGKDLAQLDVARIDLEVLAAGGNFGTRLTHKPVQPGVFVRAITGLSNALAGPDTIFTTLQLIGRDIS